MMEIRRSMMNAQKRIQVTWNQLARPMETGTFEAYKPANVSISYSDGVITAVNNTGGSGDAQSLRTTYEFRRVIGEKLYASIMLKPSFTNARFALEFAGTSDRAVYADAPANVWTRHGKIAVDATSTRNSRLYVPEFIYQHGPSAGDTEQLKSLIVVNLTTMYGAGNEPTAAEFERQCALNGIDLTEAQAQTSGTLRWWII